MNTSKTVGRNLFSVLVGLCLLAVFTLIFTYPNFRTNIVCEAVESTQILITNAEDFVSFAQNCNQSTEYYAGREVYLTSDIDLSEYEFCDYSLTKFSGAFSGAYGGKHYTMRGVNINFTVDKYVGLFGELLGSVTDLNIYASFDGMDKTNPSSTTKVAVVAAKTAESAIINNCYINFDVQNADSLTSTQFFAVAGLVIPAATIDNLYLDATNSTATVRTYYASRKQYVNFNKSITGVCANVLAQLNDDYTVDFATPKLSQNVEFWTANENGDLILKIMLPNEDTGGEPDDGKSDPQNPSEDPIPQPKTKLTPKLASSPIYYSAAAPNLEIIFEGAEENVEYTINFDKNCTWEVGNYTATILLNSKNYELTTDIVEFEILPYPIEIIWSTDNLEYNAMPQAPKFTFEPVEFAPNLVLEYENKFTNAGNYTAKLIEPKNFTLKNGSVDFKIKPYTLSIGWSDTELTYNAKPQAPQPSFEINDITKSVELVLGGYETNAKAGYYVAFVQMKDANFTLDESASCHFRINPFEITVDWEENHTFEYNAKRQVLGYNLNLPDFANINNFYEELSAEPIMVGTYTIKVKAKDSGNYRILSPSATFEIIKYQLFIKWSDTTRLTYNGKPQMPAYEYELPQFCNSISIEELNKFTDVGKYTAQLFVDSEIISIKNSACPYEIVPYNLDIVWSNCELTYNGEAQSPSAKVGNCDFAEIELEVTGSGTDMGDYKAQVSIVSDNAQNFVLNNSKVEFTILPYEFVAEWDSSPIIYDATPHAPNVLNNLPAFAKGITIIYSNTEINAGTNYITSISLANDERGNFVITNPTCNFDIIAASVNVNWLANQLIFNGENQFPEFAFVENFATEFTLKGMNKNVGEYTAEIISKNSNYYFVNNICDYSIKPYQITLIWLDTALKYNTYLQKPVVYYIKTDFCNDIDIIVNGEQKDVGEYLATAQILGNELGNFELSNPECSFSIIQKEIKINWQKIEFIYDGNEHSPTFELSESFSDLVVVCDSYLDKGTYIVTITTANTNYKLLNSTTSFTILPQPITVEWSNIQFEYNSKFHCPNATFGDLELQISGAQKNAGEYIANCTCPNENYVIENPTQKFVINKYVVNIEWVGDSFVYNGWAQIPSVRYELPTFANVMDFRTTGESVNVGENYIAEILCSNNNYELVNCQKLYTITPCPINIEWGETTLVYNGEKQQPQFTLVKNLLDENIEISTSGVGKAVGSYTICLTTSNSNVCLINANCNYEITPYKLVVNWQDKTFVYNNFPQKPEYRISVPTFASDLDFVESAGNIEAGTHTAKVSISADCADANNFVLSNDSKTYEIEPFILDLKWTSIDTIYSGKLHKPTVTYVDEITFDALPELIITGGAVLVGNYVAFAKIENPNFVLSNPECPYIIYPQAVECECEQATIQVSAPNEQVLEKIDVKNILEDDFAVPHGQNFIFGFEISAIVQIPSPMAKTFAIQSNAIAKSGSSNSYFVKLYLSPDFVMPENASLYLYADSEYMALNYELNDNTISFVTTQLGKIYLATPENNIVFLPLAITFGCITIVLLAVLVYQIIKYKKSKKLSKK